MCNSLRLSDDTRIMMTINSYQNSEHFFQSVHLQAVELSLENSKVCKCSQLKR